MGKCMESFKKRIKETQALEFAEYQKKLRIVDMLRDGYSMSTVASMSGLTLVEVRSIDSDFGLRR